MPTKTTTVTPEQIERVAELRELLPVGTVVYTARVHTSKSGMTHDLTLHLPQGPSEWNTQASIRDLTGAVLKAFPGWFKRSPSNWAIRRGGCGMDMGFDLVYSLSRTLYPAGFPCTGESSCPSNDHSNDYGRLCREYDDNHETAAAGVLRTSHDDWSAYVAERQEWIKAQPTYSVDRNHSDGGYALNHRWL